MPVQTSYPGVYIQEVPSGVNTITGVATSIAAFIGRTAKGPLDRAIRCLNFSDFQRSFGGAHDKSDLAASVKQFFDNGGTDCYVVRIAHHAAKAAATLKNSLEAKVLTATARDGGLWGNNLFLTVDYNTATPDETFNLTVTFEEAGKVVSSEVHSNLSMNPNHVRYAPVFVSQSSTLVDLAKDASLNLNANVLAGFSEGRKVIATGDLVVLKALLNNMIHNANPALMQSRFALSVDGSAYIDIDLHLDPTPITALTLPLIVKDLQDRINLQLAAAQPGLKILASLEVVNTDLNVLRLTSDTTDKISARVRRSQTKDFAGPMMLGLDQGGIEAVRYSNFRPMANATLLTGDINTLAKQVQNAFTSVTVAGTAVSLLKNGTSVLQTTGAADPWYKDANGGTDGVREKLKILAKHINATPNLDARAEVWGHHLAIIPTTGTNNTASSFASAAFDVTTLFKSNTRRFALGTTSTSLYLSDGVNGRDDDGNPLDVADYLGSEADQTGIYALNAVDLFNLMVIPGDREIDENSYLSVATTASIFCKQKRAFLILDAPDSWTVKNRPVADAADVNGMRAFVVTDHSAVYYPKVVYSDAGIKKTMGPSGMIAGLYARTDNDAGVWKAPAGVTATLQGAIDLEFSLTDGENGVLNKLGVNCLRKFPSGNVSWGARTLAGSDDLGSEWKYVPIRRLALMIGESLYRGSKWAVFEPNDEPLWARIRQSTGTFMHNLFRQGAFQGSSPSQAYYVKCDKETTTQADRNLGIVNIQVGFAPLKPAEFVVIQIQQMAGEL